MSLSTDLKLKMCRRTVTAAGTREAFYTGPRGDYLAKAIRIRAYATNTGNLYIGGDNRVSATDFSDILAPGESLTIEVGDLGRNVYINLTKLWIDAAVSGDGLSYTAIMESEPI
jgi:hypothetical protein